MLKGILFSFILPVMCFFGGDQTLAAEISVDECVGDCLVHSGFVIIKGDIVEGDLAVIKALYATKPKSLPGRYATLLDSYGGNLVEAIKIAKWARQHAPYIAVGKDNACMSSCVMILAAGQYKYPDGKIGIHRPYLTERPDVPLQQVMDTVLNTTREYLTSINIPQSLAEDMFTIPPEDMKILSKADLTKYRLDQTDIVANEEESLKQAKRLGISRMEYMKRTKNLKSSKAMDVCMALKDTTKQRECSLHMLFKFGLLVSLDSAEQEPVDISDMKYEDHCTGKLIGIDDDPSSCSDEDIWMMSVRDFLADHPEINQGSERFDALNAEVKRRQASEEDRFNPRILYEAYRDVMAKQ